jgi:hypothetical protein
MRWLWRLAVILAAVLCAVLLFCLHVDPLQHVHKGMTQDEVHTLLGPAAFSVSEGFVGPGLVLDSEIRYRLWDVLTVHYSRGYVVGKGRTSRRLADVWSDALQKIGWKTATAPPQAVPSRTLGLPVSPVDVDWPESPSNEQVP